MSRIDRRRRVLPGFGLSLGVALTYSLIIIALSLIATVIRTASLGWETFWRIVSSYRALATYRITLMAAGLATLFNGVFGLLMAWVLVRYRFSWPPAPRRARRSARRTVGVAPASKPDQRSVGQLSSAAQSAKLR